VELGFDGPDIDAEHILMCARLWDDLGLDDVRLEINSLGSSDERAAHRAALITYLEQHKARLDEDASAVSTRTRCASWIPRILTCRISWRRRPLADFLGEESLRHFDGVQTLLKDAGLPYRINHRLVRGLDYYNRTVFEWVTTRLGAQGTICAGGRYDGLVAQLGGKPAPAAGFAMGVERLSPCGRSGGQAERVVPDVCGACGRGRPAGRLPRRRRLRGTGFAVTLHCGGGSFKSQMKRADASGAPFAVVIGDDEAAAGEVSLKPLRDGGEQIRVPMDVLPETLADRLIESEEDDGSI
jgi:histidyl-tRNA synthetase